jgi:hypothetical protein
MRWQIIPEVVPLYRVVRDNDMFRPLDDIEDYVIEVGSVVELESGFEKTNSINGFTIAPLSL